MPIVDKDAIGCGEAVWQRLTARELTIPSLPA